ncbi:MAG TPA: hypothetical protein VMV94_06590 [Phycisphaerae bacterium]|nr:hypothetical protein [Phycisphaerae bacterium]
MSSAQTPTSRPATQPATQPAQKPTAETHPQNPELWDVDQMMEDAVLQISRRYNLNKAQENYTRLLLVGRVREFLDKYEKDVRELLKESIDLKLHPDKGTPEAYKKWAERAEPIYEAAKKTILEGNTEWREILNEEQRKLHDSDLAQMRTNFDQISKVMTDWKNEKGPGIPPRGDQTVGSVSQQPPAIEHRLTEDNWMAYVMMFISAYQLDEKQANSAKVKIYTEFLGKAKAYRERKKEEFDKIDAELKHMGPEGKTPAKPMELLQKKGELEQPIRTLFVEMNERLNELLRTDQKRDVDKEKKKQLAILYAKLAGEHPKKGETAGSVTSRPAETPTTSSAPAGEAGPPKEPTTQKSGPSPGGEKSTQPAKPSPAEPEKKAQPEQKPEPAQKDEKPPAATQPTK